MQDSSKRSLMLRNLVRLFTLVHLHLACQNSHTVLRKRRTHKRTGYQAMEVDGQAVDVEKHMALDTAKLQQPLSGHAIDLSSPCSQPGAKDTEQLLRSQTSTPQSFVLDQNQHPNITLPDAAGPSSYLPAVEQLSPSSPVHGEFFPCSHSSTVITRYTGHLQQQHSRNRP